MFTDIRSKYPTKEIVVDETGWVVLDKAWHDDMKK
jgi:hypothetical protein